MKSALAEVQEVVAQFAARHSIEFGVETACLDLASEVGELVKELLSVTAYGQQTFKATAAWKLELGDVLYSVLSLANQSQTPLDEALEAALSKYQERWHQRGSIASDE